MKDKLSISFSRADDSHARRIRELVRSAYAKWIPIIGREPMPMRVNYADVVRINEIDLLMLDREIAGVVEMIRNYDYLWIENIAVDPRFQGNGYGKLLLSHCEKVAADYGLNEIRLLTNQAFRSNISLYRNAGYRITHTEPFMGGTTAYLSKKIA